MAFIHGSQARFLYHGSDFSAYAEEVDPSFDREMAEYRPLTSKGVQRLPGYRTLSISVSGLYSGDDGGSGEQVWAVFDDGLGHPFAYLPQGYDAAQLPAYCGVANISSEKVTAGNGIIKMPVSVISADEFDRGLTLTPLARATMSADSAVCDGKAQSANGGAAYLFCTAIDPGCTGTITIEQSADGAAFTPLIIFDALTATGSQLQLVTGTVERYLRVSSTVVGGGLTTLVAFARR